MHRRRSTNDDDEPLCDHFPYGKVPEEDSRLDLVVLELGAAGIVFRQLP